MTITSQDIKIFQSQNMADTADGGGQPTGTEVVDGQLNNVFDNNARLDRVNGHVQLRLVYGAVTTATRDKYLGAHAILSRPPSDPLFNGLILDFDTAGSQRSDAQGFVEQYLLASVETQLTLYSSQPQNARTVIAYQGLSDELPAIGDVICLSVETAASSLNGTQQFVRITGISSRSITFSDAQGNYTKQLVTLTISDPLTVTFPGNDPSRSPAPSSKPTRIRKADLNPSVRYYGITPVTAAIHEGDTTVHVRDVLQPIVPAAYAESPLLDQQIGASTQPLVAAGPTFTETFSRTPVGGITSVQLLRAALPGSVVVTGTAGGNNATLTDQGAGVLARTGGDSPTTGAAGTAVYGGGQISLTGLPNVAYSLSVAYTPAAAVSDVQNTSGILITLLNRGFNYSQTLLPKPAPGAVVVNFRSLGRWYQLLDNGKGQLTGAAGVGAGTVNYLTGTVNATLGYQPDVGSHVLFGWGTGAHVTQNTDSTTARLSVSGTVAADAGLVPGSVTITWPNGGTKTATDDGHGVFTGDGAGTIDYATGNYKIIPNALVAAGTVFSLSANKKTPRTETPAVSTSGSNKTFTLAHTPVAARTFTASATYAYGGQNYTVTFIASVGDGTVIRVWVIYAASGFNTSTTVGTLDLGTGAATLPVTLTNALRTYAYNAGAGAWDGSDHDLTFVSLDSVSYTDDGGSSTSSSTSATLATLDIDFSRALIQHMVTGSLLFTVGGRSYVESGGTLYTRDNTGTLVAAGTLDPLTGLGTINTWFTGSSTVTINALLTKYGQWMLSSVIWRTAGSPLRSQSFQVTDGTHVAGSAVDNTISSAGFITSGSINLDTGVYQLTFSSGHVPETLRYNAVALTYLPVDADILGLNAVRLPLDGRVPIFQSGGDLVILNDQTDTLTNPVVAGSTYTLSRGQLAYAQVFDANGQKVPTDRYTADLDAGTVTMANPLDLSGYAQPLKVEHRIEDMIRCVDAQLSGDVTVSRGVARDFPASGTFVATVKQYGTLQSRAYNLFSQQAWTGVWSESLIGNGTVGQYNAPIYPVEVDNKGAITERWRLEFTGPNAFRLIGEKTGLIDSGNTLGDFSPINPNTGTPYLTIRAAGWGSGWGAGNQVRFNTQAASAPIWLAQVELPGPVTVTPDSARLEFRGDN